MTNYKINKKIIKTIIVMGIFAVLPLVASDLRADRVFAIQINQYHQHGENYEHNHIKQINYFEDLLKSHYYSSIFVKSAWSNWSENIKNLLAMIKGEDAVKLAKSLNDEAILSFAEVTDDKTGEIIIEIYDTSVKIKKEKEPVISF